MDGQYVAYYRVSTGKQGRSGLGLEGQQEAVRRYLNGGSWQLLAEFTEVESGADDSRPKLAAAFRECRMTGARLIIAKLDRLSRDAHFLFGLEKAGIAFTAADMPNANQLTVGIMAVVAQEERRMISDRTKAALAAAKARGTVLGGYRVNAPLVDPSKGREALAAKADAHALSIRPVLEEMRGRGLSLRRMMAELEARSIRTPRGGAWTATAVKRAMERIVPS